MGDSSKFCRAQRSERLRNPGAGADLYPGAACNQRADGENMASFPDLRPSKRSAKAESKAAHKFRTPVLLAVSAALLLTAFLAVSELATLRGAKAHDASAFLTRALGSPLNPAPLVRTPARGVKVNVRHNGYRVTHGKASLFLGSPVSGRPWHAYEHGAQRATRVGRETILIDGSSAEEFLTVSSHQGRHTWRWRLDTHLHPRVTPKGVVGFFSGNKLSPLAIEPVAILDARGRDVTPRGLHWSVSRLGKNTWLQLTFDDTRLETPYTIDPTISFRAAGTVATSASGTTISVGIPGGALNQDLLLMQVASASATIPSTPTGWAVVTNTNTANTNVSQVVFWKKASGTDGGTSVPVTIPNAPAVGVVTVYKGVDTSLNPPIQQNTTSNSANSRDVTCPALTTNAANEMVVCAGSIAENGTWPASGGGYTRQATGAQSTNVSFGWYDQFVATSGTSIAAATFTNVAANPKRNIANTFGLPVDTTNPTNGLITITGVSPAGVAYLAGGTIYYRGSVAGQFQIQDPFSDAKSALDHVNYPLVSSAGWTHANQDVTTAPSFTSANYQWIAGTTTPPLASERTLKEYDGAGNNASQIVPIVNDSTAPTGQTISLTGTAAAPNYYNTSSVSFTLGDGSDSGAGLDTSTRTVTRETAPLSGDSCGSFSADAGSFTSPDTSVSSGNCYRYTFTIKDNVGNTSAAVTATAKVDGANPTVTVSAPTEVTGAGNQYYNAGSKTQYFRPAGSGSFTLNATAADVHTAVTQVAFPDVSGVSGWSGSTGGIDATSPYASPVDYTWTAGASAPGARTLTATDKATNSGTDTISITADSSAPTGQTISLTGTAAAPNYYNTSSVSFTLGDGSDSGAGLDTSTRTVTRETAPLSGDSCGSFSADAGSFTSPDTSVSSGNCYRYTFTIKDNVGNTSAAVTATAKVDGANPTVTVSAPTEVTGAGNQYYNAGSKTQYFRPAGSGSFTLNATAADVHTAVTQVAFPDVSGVSGWSGSTGGIDATSPYASPVDYTWTAGASAPGARTLTATDKATNSGTDTISITADSSAPTGQTISLTGTAAAPNYYNTSSVSFTLGDGSDSGAGLDTSSRTVTRETAPLSGDSCGSFSADAGSFTSPDTSVSSGNCYRYTFTIKDNVGNTSAAVTATAKV